MQKKNRFKKKFAEKNTLGWNYRWNITNIKLITISFFLSQNKVFWLNNKYTVDSLVKMHEKSPKHKAWGFIIKYNFTKQTYKSLGAEKRLEEKI